MATEAPAQASTAASAAGASRSSASAARTAAIGRVGVQGGVEPDGLAPGGQALHGRGQDLVGPHPVVAVVLGEQRQPDRHRVDARPPGASRPAPGCPWTSTSSRRRVRPSRCARRPARTAGRWRPEPPRHTSRGAGRSDRSRRPGRRSRSPAGSARSPCTRCASPAGHAPAGSPSPARRDAAVARPDSPGDPACPVGPGHRPARRRPPTPRCRARWDSEPKSWSVDRAK